jgi:predicted HTH domain antitoxin
MKTVTLNIPEELEMNQQDIEMLVATQLYEHGKLSLGQAALMVNLSKQSFAELLARYQVSIFNYPASDIAKDVANA